MKNNLKVWWGAAFVPKKDQMYPDEMYPVQMHPDQMNIIRDESRKRGEPNNVSKNGDNPPVKRRAAQNNSSSIDEQTGDNPVERRAAHSKSLSRAVYSNSLSRAATNEPAAAGHIIFFLDSQQMAPLCMKRWPMKNS